MITKKSKYAYKAMLILVDEYGRGPVLISTISEKANIPKKFLEVILLELRHAGYVDSKKGKGGKEKTDRNSTNLVYLVY